MIPTARVFIHLLRLLVLVTAVAWAGAVRADDYTDVNGLVRSGKLAEARAKADQYLAGKPRDPQMRFLKGVIQTEAGQTGDAIATFTALNQDYPELAEPYNNLAVLYAGQAQFEKARAALEMAIRTNPNYAVAYENLGDVYAKLASLSYVKAQQLDATNTSVPAKLALIRQLFPLSPARGQSGIAVPPLAPKPAQATAGPAPARTAIPGS